MTKKIIFYILFTIIIIITILLYCNINNYIAIINACFRQNITINNFYYIIICLVIALLSTLYIIAIKLLIFPKKEEIQGIKFKNKDGTYGTANWLNDNEIEQILGKNNTPGLILGKRNNEIIKLPFESHFNKNIAVFGSSGSMKTIRFSYNKLT